MQSANNKEPGPGKLTTGMSPLELMLTLEYNLKSIPHVAGVNNHMGSKLTANHDAMQLLMRAMKKYPGLFFVDSVTSPRTVAARTAKQHQVPSLSRDIFLDNEQNAAAIDAQFRKLIRLARKRGYALAIGHPYPVTLSTLERWLPKLDTYRVKLVTPSTLISLQQRGQTP